MLNGGVRYNFIKYTLEASEMLNSSKSSEQYTNLNPSLGLKYKLIPNLNIHGSIGNAFYVPDAYKTAGVYKVGKTIYAGNKDLKPETSFSYDIGINYGVDDRFNLDLTYFQSYYKNKIVNDNESRKDTTSYKNASDGMMNGIEILLSSNIARFWDAPYKIELYGGLSYFFNNNFKDSIKNNLGEKTEVTRDMLYVRKATANFGINFQNKNGFEARFNARYIGHRLENDWNAYYGLRPDIKSSDYYAKGGYTDANQILRHSAHLVFDLSTHYTVNRKFRIGVSVANLLDENYSEKDGYNMPGRNAMGHFSYQF